MKLIKESLYESNLIKPTLKEQYVEYETLDSISPKIELADFEYLVSCKIKTIKAFNNAILGMYDSIGEFAVKMDFITLDEYDSEDFKFNEKDEKYMNWVQNIISVIKNTQLITWDRPRDQLSKLPKILQNDNIYILIPGSEEDDDEYIFKSKYNLPNFVIKDEYM